MSDIDYSDDDEQRSLNSQGSVSSVDSSTFVTHKNLLPIPPKLNIPNKPKKINKLTMADTVDHPKTKACAAKGNDQLLHSEFDAAFGSEIFYLLRIVCNKQYCNKELRYYLLFV